MFQEIKQIALKCTNHTPENIMPTLLLRVQAKHITGKLSAIYQTAEMVATRTLSYMRTCVTKAFILGSISSTNQWVLNEWAIIVEDKSYAFFDGNDDPDYCKTRINNVPLILTILTFAINSLKF